MSTLRKWRNAQSPKISQAELGARLDTTQSHVCEIERAEDNVSLEVAGRVFAATGVRIGRLRDTTDKQAKAVAEVTAR